MKKYIHIICCLVCSLAYAETPSRLLDGKVQLAFGEVNGQVCWTQSEQEKAIAHYESMSSTVVFTAMSYVPDKFEVTLATSGIKFDNFTDYQRARDEKAYLEDKLDDLKPSQNRKMKSSIDFLRKENAKR